MAVATGNRIDRVKGAPQVTKHDENCTGAAAAPRFEGGHHEMLRVKPFLISALLVFSTTSAHSEDMVVTQFGAALSGAPYAIALDQGYFKKGGVNVTGFIAGMGGGTTARNLIASGLGYGEVVFTAAVAAILDGQDIKIVNVGSRTVDDLVLLVKPDSPIKSTRDLAGTKIGFSSPKSLSEIVTVMSVEQAGLPLDKVERVALGSLGGALTALERGSIDVAASLRLALRPRTDKFRVIIDGGKDLPPMVQSVGVATGDLIRTGPDKLRAMILARRQGADFLYANPKQSLEILAKYFDRIPRETLERMVTGLVADQHWSRGDFEMDRLTRAAHGLKLVGGLTKEIDWSAVIDKSFLPADLQK